VLFRSLTSFESCAKWDVELDSIYDLQVMVYFSCETLLPYISHRIRLFRVHLCYRRVMHSVGQERTQTVNAHEVPHINYCNRYDLSCRQRLHWVVTYCCAVADVPISRYTSVRPVEYKPARCNKIPCAYYL